MRNHLRHYGWVALVFLLSELVAWRLGVRFAHNTLGTLYQYLDPEILRNDLLRGIFYLHSQPPLYNLLLGWGLKWFPDSYPTAFAGLYSLGGLCLLLGTAWLMEKLGAPRRVILVLSLLFALTPSFLAYTHWLFYTLPVALIILAGAVALALYLESGHLIWAIAFSGSAGILMLARSLYHPIWLVGVLAAVVLFLDRPKRRALVLSAVAPVVLTLLVYVKNHALVDSFSGSSWLGLSLAKRWPLSQGEIESLRQGGHLPPSWHRRPFREPRELEALGYFRGGTWRHPACDAPYKSNGEPNFNHHEYARISKRLLVANLYLIRHYPDRYLERVITSFLLFLQPGPNSVHFLVDYDFSGLQRLRDATERLFLGGPIVRPIGMLAPPANLWLLGFPALLVFGGYRAIRRTSVAGVDRRAVYAYMVTTVLWVTLTANLIEIGENDRMRWEVEPLLIVLLGSAVTSVGSWLGEAISSMKSRCRRV